MDRMDSSVAELVNEVMRLPREARAALAGRLIDSLEARVDPDAESAWEAEIERRLSDVDGGQVTMVPWSRVRRQLLGS